MPRQPTVVAVGVSKLFRNPAGNYCPFIYMAGCFDYWFSFWVNKDVVTSIYWTLKHNCCSVISVQPQQPLRKQAANWMLKRMTTKDSGFPDVDYFMKGKLEIIK